MRVLGPYSTMEGRLQWLEDNGYNRPLIDRYFSWLYGFITGDWKVSAQFNRPVLEFLAPRLANTAILGGCVFVITVAISLVLGVLSGIDEGGLRDRTITVASVAHDLGPGIRLGDVPGRDLRLSGSTGCPARPHSRRGFSVGRTRPAGGGSGHL